MWKSMLDEAREVVWLAVLAAFRQWVWHGGGTRSNVIVAGTPSRNGAYSAALFAIRGWQADDDMMDATATIIEANDVARSVEEARAALQRQDWEEAERALAEAQDRIGRILREISLQKERRQPNRMRAETQQSPSIYLRKASKRQPRTKMRCWVSEVRRR